MIPFEEPYEEEKLQKTIALSKQAFLEGERERPLSRLEFLGLQGRYIKKTWWLLQGVLLALVCGVVAQIGDLSFSLIKREFGIKDYGHLFLEHGGVLDRFDSVLFVTPVIEITLRLIQLWK